MRSKYVTEKFPKFYEFGRHPDSDTVDIACGNNLTLATMPLADAEAVIKEHNRTVDALTQAVMELHKADPERCLAMWRAFDG